MFRITAHYDDRWHPLNGDVVTVASVAEALAAMPDYQGTTYFLESDFWAPVSYYGDGVTYTVERV